MAKNSRAGGGAKIKASGPAGTVGKPRGLKPNSIKPTASSSSRMKPLRGVNAAVRGNLSGFKGLPVALRSREEAGRAYRQRTRATIETTRSQVIGAGRGVTATAGRGQKLRVQKFTSNQGNLFGGSSKAVNTVVSRVPSSKGPAPGSKSARRLVGASRRASEGESKRLARVSRRADSVVERRASDWRASSRKKSQSKATQGKAIKYLYNRRHK